MTCNLSAWGVLNESVHSYVYGGRQAVKVLISSRRVYIVQAYRLVWLSEGR